MNVVGLSADITNRNGSTVTGGGIKPMGEHDPSAGEPLTDISTSPLHHPLPTSLPNGVVMNGSAHLSPNTNACAPTSSTPSSRQPPSQFTNTRVSESSSRESTNGDDPTMSPFVDEEFMTHYNVKEIQNNVVNSLVDEEFLRHYRVDEIAASMGFPGPYTGNYGYDYFMGAGGPGGGGESFTQKGVWCGFSIEVMWICIHNTMWLYALMRVFCDMDLHHAGMWDWFH